MTSPLDPRFVSDRGDVARATPEPAQAAAEVPVAVPPLTVLWLLILGQCAIFSVPLLTGLVSWETLGGDLQSRLWSEQGALQLGSFPSREPWRLLTTTALHASVLHLVGNMVGLFAIGRMLGTLLGPRRLLTVYLASALGGSLASLVWGSLEDSVGQTVGASGAVFGCGWAIVAALARHRKRLPPGANSTAWRLGAYLTLLLAGSVVIEAHTDMRIDHAAHLGGSLIGLAVGLLPIRWLFRSRRTLAAIEGTFGALGLILTLGVPTVALSRGAPTAEQVYAQRRLVVLEPHRLTVGLPLSWNPGEDGAWQPPNGRGELKVTKQPAAIQRSYSLLALEDLWLASAERQVRSGVIRSYERVWRDDLDGQGLGGILIGVRLDFGTGTELVFLRWVDLGLASFEVRLSLPDTPFDMELGLLIMNGLSYLP